MTIVVTTVMKKTVVSVRINLNPVQLRFQFSIKRDCIKFNTGFLTYFVAILCYGVSISKIYELPEEIDWRFQNVVGLDLSSALQHVRKIKLYSLIILRCLPVSTKPVGLSKQWPLHRRCETLRWKGGLRKQHRRTKLQPTSLRCSVV